MFHFITSFHVFAICKSLDANIYLSGRGGSMRYLKKENFGLGFYYNGKNPDSTGYPLVNELIYYKEKKYRDPWYMDNVGSFLIVIERKTNK